MDELGSGLWMGREFPMRGATCGSAAMTGEPLECANKLMWQKVAKSTWRENEAGQ